MPLASLVGLLILTGAALVAAALADHEQPGTRAGNEPWAADLERLREATGKR